MNIKELMDRIQLSVPQRIWLQALYDKFKANEAVTYRKLKAELKGKIPVDFQPNSIGWALLKNEDKIAFLGILKLDPDTEYLKFIDKILTYNKNLLIKEPDRTDITSEQISQETGLTVTEIANSLEFSRELGRFFDGSSGGPDNSYKSITIRDDETFDQYFRYDNIEKLIESAIEKNYSDKKSAKAYSGPDNFLPSGLNYGYLPISQAVSTKEHSLFKTKIAQIDRRLCFVLMPFKQDWSDRIYHAIRDNVEKLGLQCLRADNLGGPIIIEDIWTKINQCAFVIADVTGRNPNVMYEMGIVHAIDKPAILLTQEINSIPFDFAHLRHYEYQDVTGTKFFNDDLPNIVKNFYKEYYKEDIT